MRSHWIIITSHVVPYHTLYSFLDKDLRPNDDLGNTTETCSQQNYTFKTYQTCFSCESYVYWTVSHFDWFEEDGGDQLETKDVEEEAMERNNWASQNSQRVVELKEEEASSW